METKFKISKPTKVEFYTKGYEPKSWKDQWIWKFVLKEMPKLKAKPNKDYWIEFNLGRKRFKLIRLK